MRNFAIIFLLIQILLIVFYSLFTTYESPKQGSDVPLYYGFLMDVHMMIFVGFGFLMVFLRKYGYSAAGFTLLLSVFAIEIAILFNGLWEGVLKN